MNDDTIPMKTCTKCGEEKPATLDFFCRKKRGKYGLNSMCKDCVSVYRNRYYMDNHADAIAYAAAYRKNFPEKVSDSRSKYLKNNRLKLARVTQQWTQKNPDYRKKWEAKNPEKVFTMRLRRNARKRNLPDNFTDNDWQRALDYFNGCCAVCGRQLKDLFGTHTVAADHWIPISYEGDDNPGTVPQNIVPLCHGEGGCNNRKSAKLPHVWLKEQFGSRKANEIMARIQAYYDSIDTDRTKRNAR